MDGLRPLQKARHTVEWITWNLIKCCHSTRKSLCWNFFCSLPNWNRSFVGGHRDKFRQGLVPPFNYLTVVPKSIVPTSLRREILTVLLNAFGFLILPLAKWKTSLRSKSCRCWLKIMKTKLLWYMNPFRGEQWRRKKFHIFESNYFTVWSRYLVQFSLLIMAL